MNIINDKTHTYIYVCIHTYIDYNYDLVKANNHINYFILE